MRGALIWTGLAAVLAVPVAAAAFSPLLAWRDPIYVAAGFAGIVAMALLVMQPLLAGGFLPGLNAVRARLVHRACGLVILAAVLLHVAGLWLTSRPDVIDALLFVSPTPFSPWGVVAMWALIATTGLALMWRKLRVRPKLWQRLHLGMGAVIVLGTILHALLVVGTMEPITKWMLAGALIAATGKLALDRRKKLRKV